MTEPTTARYDLALESPGPAAGDLYVRTDGTGEPTGVWYVILGVRVVRQRRPHPYRRWALTILRQDGPVPEDDRIAWPCSAYPRGLDVDDYWQRRMSA